MKTLFTKKFFAFIIPVVLSMMFSAGVNAQVVYTDVNPDTLITGTYLLDLNHDGINEFELTHRLTISSTGLGMGACRTVTNTCIAYARHFGAVAANATGAVVLSSSTNIDSTLNWNDTTVSYGYNSLSRASYRTGICRPHFPPTSSGNWLNQNDKYLGLRFIKNGLTYYGWARLHVAGASYITIKDYAFNSFPGQPILAGQGANFAAITTIVGSPFCAGGSISIPYIIQGAFNPGNIFTAELSNASGNFSFPVAIGTTTSSLAGTINGVIPPGTLTGIGYRIRLVSTNPVKTSSDNGTNLVINTALVTTITSSNNPACGSITMYAPTGTGNTYQWKLNGTSIAGALSYSYSATVPGNYYCLVTNGCGSIASNVINAIVKPYPVAAVTTSGPIEVCPGSSVTLFANSGIGLSYQWNSYGTAIPGATFSAYTATSTSALTVTVTNTYGCSRTPAATYVNVQIPTVAISNSRSLTFCAGDSTVLSTANNPVLVYQWRKNGVNIPGATTYHYTAFASGVYKVNAINPNGNCHTLSAGKTVNVSCRLSAPHNSEELAPQHQVMIVPNPIFNSATISFSLNQPGKVSIRIFDITGKLVKTLAERNFDEGDNSIVWNVEDVHEGIYFLKMESSEFSLTEKLIVVK